MLKWSVNLDADANLDLESVRKKTLKFLFSSHECSYILVALHSESTLNCVSLWLLSGGLCTSFNFVDDSGITNNFP